MKKKLLLTVSGLLAFLAIVCAQTGTINSNRGVHKNQQIKNMLHAAEAKECSADSTRNYSWDTLSANWAFVSTDYYTYDGANRVVTVINKKWSGAVLNNYEKYDITYDAHGNILTFITQDWNGTTWVNNFKDQFTYNAANKQLTYLGQQWVGGWNDRYIENDSYDSGNNNISTISLSYNGPIWDTVIHNRTFNSNNKLVTETTQNGHPIQNVNRSAYTYDSNNNTLTEIYEFWDSTTWVNYSKTTRTYAGIKLSSSLTQYWESSNSVWTDSRKETYTYSGNNLSILLGEYWNGSVWLTGSKETYMYDAQNNETQKIQQSWDGSAWLNNYLSLYSYDSNGYLISFSEKMWINATITGDSMHNHTCRLISGLYEKISSADHIQIYPNPANDIISIQGVATESTIRITNIMGQEIMHVVMKGDKAKIDISSLASGFYFLNNQKFIKQ